MAVVCSEWRLTVAIKPSPLSCLCSFPVADQILDSISSKAWSLFLIIVDIRKLKKQSSLTQRESLLWSN